MTESEKPLINTQIQLGSPEKDTTAPPHPEISGHITKPAETKSHPEESTDANTATQALQSSAHKIDEESSRDSQVCAVCQCPAKSCCKACINIGILDLPGQAKLERTFYCSKECQTFDWPKHKNACKIAQVLIDNKMLSRAAIFLQKAFYMFRKSAFDLSIESIEVKEDTVVIKEGKYDARKVLVDFPEDLVKEEEPFVRNMLYTLMACTDQFRSLHDLCNAFLKGMCAKFIC